MMRTRLVTLARAALVLACAVAAHAQTPRPDTAEFSGRVVRKDDATPIAGATVNLAALHRLTTTDSAGRFSFASLPWGLHSVQVQHLGHVLVRDTVTIDAEFPVIRTYALEEQTPVLPAVHSEAGATKYLSPTLREFEQRRLSHEGGSFISDSVFRANESSTLANVMGSRMPGLMFELVASRRLPVSTRKMCQGPALLHPCTAKQDCWVAIYLDGQLYFNVAISHEVPVEAWPDFDKTFSLNNLAGAEYYPDAASAPIGMHVDDDGCGSLWLWTREH